MKKKNSLFMYSIVFFIPVIVVLVHMIMTGCYPFGNNTILLGDGNLQYISFMKLLVDKVKHGEGILFDWHVGMGTEFYQNFFYYLASPFNVIAVIVGLFDVELGVILSMLIQVGMCGVTMMFYLVHTSKNTCNDNKNNRIICMLFALAYSMSDYILAYQYNYIWLISLLLAPLVMLGVEQTIEEKRVALYIFSLIAVFITNFYFAWYICILSVIWCIDSLIIKRRKVIKDIVRYVCASVIAALSSCFVLIPCYLAALGREYSTINKSEFTYKVFGNIANYFQGFLWGASIDTGGKLAFTNNNYVGVVTLILTVLYVFIPQINKGKKIKRLVLICILSFLQNWSLGVYVLHGFTFPNMLFSRNMFILELVLIVSAFEAMINLKQVKSSWCIEIGFIMTLFIVIALYGNTAMESSLCYLGSIAICSYVLICLVLFSKCYISRKTLIIIVLVVSFAEIISNAYIVSKNNYEVSKDYKMAAELWSDEYEQIENKPGERKTSWVESQNSMSYSDTNIYSSIMCRSMIDWNRALGLTYQGNGASYVYKGTTPVTAMLSNVRSVLTDNRVYFGGYDCKKTKTIYNNYINNTSTYGVYESDYLVGLGYMVPKDIATWNLSGNPFEVQNDLTNRIIGIGDVFEKVEASNIAIASNGCDIIGQDEYRITYKNTMEKKETYANVMFQFEVPDDMNLYICVHDDAQLLCYVYVDSEPMINDSEYITQTEMINIGNVKRGQTVTLLLSNNSSYNDIGTTDIWLYKFKDNVMGNVLNTLNYSPLNIEQFCETNIKGTISSDYSGIMYTSIPYYKGISIFVDGEKTEIIKIGGTMCGIELEEGEHRIEIKYFPYGLKLGIILSALGFILVFLFVRGKEKVII